MDHFIRIFFLVGPCGGLICDTTTIMKEKLTFTGLGSHYYIGYIPNGSWDNNGHVMTGMHSIVLGKFQTHNFISFVETCVVSFQGNGLTKFDFVWTWPWAIRDMFERHGWSYIISMTFLFLLCRISMRHFLPRTALSNQFPLKMISV